MRARRTKKLLRMSLYSFSFDVPKLGLNGRSGRPYTCPQKFRVPNSIMPRSASGAWTSAAGSSVASGLPCCFGCCATPAGTSMTRTTPSANRVLILISLSSLPQERIARGVVRPVDLGMAVRATAIEVTDGVEECRHRGVAAGDVARVAHPRHSHLEQLRVVCAMWFVAVRAVFHDRRVLPKEGPAALGVAAVAVLVCRSLEELVRVRRAMGIVAAGAGYLAFSVGHVRRALQLRAPHQVTLQAQFRLLFPRLNVGQRRVEAGVRRKFPRLGFVPDMATHTSDVSRFVRAPIPE